MNQWRLHVENFGKIAKATVDVSPFMIFVGKNNSGKSYLMVLLWGILTEAKLLVKSHLRSHEDYNDLFRRIKAETELALSKGRGDLVFERKLQRELLGIFNSILNTYKGSFLERVFRHPISIGSITIEKQTYLPIKFSMYKSGMAVVVNPERDPKGGVIRVEYSIQDQPILALSYAEVNLDGFVDFMIETVMLEMICRDFYDTPKLDHRNNRQPLYLPASRTGFMHTYRTIVGNMFRYATDFVVESLEVESEDQAVIQGAELNLPTIEFLTRLQQRDSNVKRQQIYREELNFLNDEIFQGRVMTDEKEQVRFVPRDAKTKLPLHVTSSLVAELAPISLFLESGYEPDLWIIEEVESHLHSEMQLTVARLLFRLFNKGNSMWLTTHSDNLAQQINNLLTLSQHPMREELLAKLKYDEKELLSDLSVIRAYQFETKDGVTEVEQLELGKYGFEMKTFNNTLDRLVRETHLIQNYTGESND